MNCTQCNAVFRSIALLADAKLGRCSRCIRKSFIVAFSAWVAWLLVSHLPGLRDIPNLLAFSTAAPAGLTVLWVAHLVASAKRSASRLEPNARSTPAPGNQLSRRDVFPVFAKSLAAVAFWSAIPRVVSADPCSLSDNSPTGHCVNNCWTAYYSCAAPSSGMTSYQCQKEKAACERACGC